MLKKLEYSRETNEFRSVYPNWRYNTSELTFDTLRNDQLQRSALHWSVGADSVFWPL